MNSPRRFPFGELRLRQVILASLAIACAGPALAMRIIVTNDDGFESNNLQVLFTTLKAAGHDVILSAPLHNQSGASAQVGTPLNSPVTTARSPGGRIPAGSPGAGPTGIAADQYYVNSTPAAAVVFGIVVPGQLKWSAAPDLVISGPNIGTNLGTVIPHSGTVGAAVTALNRGIPSIAVSGSNGDAATATLLAEITLRIVASLEVKGKIQLPRGFGLNVNVPVLDAKRTAASYPIAFTEVTNGAGNETSVYALGTTVTVSPIQGTYQAPPEAAALILSQMRPLFTTVSTIIDPALVNLSVRGFVGVGNSVQIAGFTISGGANKTVLIRASGPVLAQFGVTGILEDPAVELVDSANRAVAANDNWTDDPAKATAISNAALRAGAFAWPRGSKDAALLVTLPPGSYTVVVRGVGNTSGVALVEVYDADNN